MNVAGYKIDRAILKYARGGLINVFPPAMRGFMIIDQRASEQAQRKFLARRSDGLQIGNELVAPDIFKRSEVSAGQSQSVN